MTGQFFFALLNPAIALVLATTFILLWRKRPARRHLLYIGIAFICCGLAFAVTDFLESFEGPVLRILSNAMFFAAILLACLATLERAGARFPVISLAVISIIATALFLWFLFVDPSVSARIYILNAAYALFAALTFRQLMKSGPQTRVDWLGLAVVVFLFLLAISRPIATLIGSLDLNVGGDLQDSVYWATVQALTPLLAIATASVFLFALVLELMGELRNEAERDYLTGLFNRRGFETRASAALAESEPALWQPALMLADIDNFKKVNDAFGHGTGDQVIVAIAAVLAAHGGASLVARTGGEEFALFYTDTRRSDLLARAQRIRSELARHAVHGLPNGHPLTLSIGIHTRHQNETLGQMMEHADRALYAAKAEGKDRAVIAPLPLRSVMDNPARMTR